MTATLWIHRASAAGILVRFPTALDAYNFGSRFMFKYQTPVEEDTVIYPWNEELYMMHDIFDVGQTPTLQISVHPGEFHTTGYLGIACWSPDGTILTTAEDAMSLGEAGIPEGFNPGNDPCGLWDNSLDANFESHYNRLDREYAEADTGTKQESAFIEGTTRYEGFVDWVKLLRRNSVNNNSDSDN